MVNKKLLHAFVFVLFIFSDEFIKPETNSEDFSIANDIELEYEKVQNAIKKIILCELSLRGIGYFYAGLALCEVFYIVPDNLGLIKLVAPIVSNIAVHIVMHKLLKYKYPGESARQGKKRFIGSVASLCGMILTHDYCKRNTDVVKILSSTTVGVVLGLFVDNIFVKGPNVEEYCLYQAKHGCYEKHETDQIKVFVCKIEELKLEKRALELESKENKLLSEILSLESEIDLFKKNEFLKISKLKEGDLEELYNQVSKQRDEKIKELKQFKEQAIKLKKQRSALEKRKIDVYEKNARIVNKKEN